MAKDDKPIATRDDVSLFLQKVKATPPGPATGSTGRLLFAMDATASREPTWDQASHLHGEMFNVTESMGGLEVQLCYYRGFMEFHKSAWCRDASSLLRELTAVRCLGGHTQISKVLKHAIRESDKKRVQAVVFIGDAMEENPDTLCHLAGQLGVRNVPVFMFQEGHIPTVKNVFQQIARLSGGAYAPFDLSSASQLRQLIGAVAVFAAGGKAALKNLPKSEPGVAGLLKQLED